MKKAIMLGFVVVFFTGFLMMGAHAMTVSQKARKHAVIQQTQAERTDRVQFVPLRPVPRKLNVVFY